MPEHKHTNKLINETSPYLLQHAHNPVDWYPWGPEALERSRTEYMIGMHVREHHEANRQARHFANPCAQALAVVQTTARVEHGYRVPAHDEADIGDRIAVGGGGILIDAATDVDPGGHRLRD